LALATATMSLLAILLERGRSGRGGFPKRAAIT